MFVILYFIFTKFLHIGDKVPHWAVALFLGLVMWEFFNEITKQGLKSVVGKGGLIRKINFPKYIIIISSSLSALINLVLNLVVVAIFVAVTNTPLTWNYLWIPVFIIELYIFSLGCAFILSTMYVKFRDIDFVWEIVTRAGFYATAVIFPMSRIFDASHKAGVVLLFNPVAQSINDARTSLLGNNIIPSSESHFSNDFLMLIPLGLVIVFIVFGAWYFRSRSSSFAEDV